MQDLPGSPQFRRGRANPIDIREMRRMEEQASRMDKLSAAGGVGVLSHVGELCLFDQSPMFLWIRLTGIYSSSPPFNGYYNWTAVRRSRDTGVWETNEQIQSGHFGNGLAARSFDDRTGIPTDPVTGPVVPAWLSDTGDFLEFLYMGGGGDVTNTNITYINTTISTPYGPTINTGPGTINNLTTPPGLVNNILTTGVPSWTGIVAGACGRRLLFVVVGTGLILRHEHAGSTDINRIYCPHEQDLVIPPDHAFELMYDCEINRWRVLWTFIVYNPKADLAAHGGGTINDYPIDLETPSFTFNLGANLIVTGLANGVDGYIRRITNTYVSPDEWTITLKHLNGGSLFENQIVTPGGVDYKIASGGGVYLYYKNEKWRVVATKDVYTTPNKLIAVGANKMAEEKAQLEIDNNQLKVIREDGVSRPEMAMNRRGSSGGNLAGGESIGAYLLKGRIDGTDKDVAGVESDYDGTGTDQTGKLKSFTYDAGVKKGGWIQHSDGSMEFVTANTPLKFLATNASGRVITTDAAATLTDTHIGFGNASNLLSGNSNFIYTGTTVRMKVPSPGGYLVEGYATASTSLARFLGGHADGSGASPSTTSDGRILMRLGGVRYNSGWQDPTAVIDMVAANTSLADIVMRTGGTSPTDRLSILNSGEIRCHGLTANKLVGTDTDKDLTSINLDSSITLSGGTLSVTNPYPGAPTITLTGDVTGSGTTSIATTIPNNTVTPAKMDDGTALSVLGRSANSSGDRADIVAGSAGDVLWRDGTTIVFAPLDGGSP